MIDPRKSLETKLLELGLDKNLSTLIALDASSSQCSVNMEYFQELEISSTIVKKVHEKVMPFYCGELSENH